MGGYGSGQRGWRTRDGVPRPIVEWTPALDPSYLDRELKIIRPGESCHRLSWCMNDDIDSRWLEIEYRPVLYAEPEVRLYIDADILTVHKGVVPKGGWRWWLECPGCHHRRNRLYAVAVGRVWRWRCRECHELVYASQRRETPDPEDWIRYRRGRGWREEHPAFQPYILDTAPYQSPAPLPGRRLFGG